MNEMILLLSRFLIVFAIIILVAYILISLFLNSFYKKIYGKGTILAWLPFTNIYLLGKLTFNKLVGWLLVIGMIFNGEFSFTVNGETTTYKLLQGNLGSIYSFIFTATVFSIFIYAIIKYFKISPKKEDSKPIEQEQQVLVQPINPVPVVEPQPVEPVPVIEPINTVDQVSQFGQVPPVQPIQSPVMPEQQPINPVPVVEQIQPQSINPISGFDQVQSVQQVQPTEPIMPSQIEPIPVIEPVMPEPSPSIQSTQPINPMINVVEPQQNSSNDLDIFNIDNNNQN